MSDQFELKELDLLTKEQCESIIQSLDKDLDHVEQGDHRDVFIKSININEHPDMLAALLDANQLFYNFDFNGITECYFAKYPAGSHYKALHIDSMVGLQHQRKLSFTLLLNDDFTGGEFCTADRTLEKKKGKLYVFPSFLPHKVDPVLAGNRYVIFGFFLGPNWR